MVANESGKPNQTAWLRVRCQYSTLLHISTTRQCYDCLVTNKPGIDGDMCRPHKDTAAKAAAPFRPPNLVHTAACYDIIITDIEQLKAARQLMLLTMTAC